MSRYYKKIDRTFSKGEIIFSENSECDGMYIIESGKVRVYKTLDTPSGPKELELVQLGPKSLFGEMALIDYKKRSASVQALEETKCAIITKLMFEDQLSQLPSWVVNLIRVLVTRLRETNEKLREKAQNFNDDTGGLVFVNNQEKGQAREAMQKLEETIETAEKKLKGISESIEDVRQKEMKAISDIAAESREVISSKSKEAGNKFSSAPLPDIRQDPISRIRNDVEKICQHIKKKKKQ